MTEGFDPNEERFAIGLQFGQVDVKFYITSKSTTGKRWAFFGLLTMIVVLMLVREIAPTLQGFMS